MKKKNNTIAFFTTSRAEFGIMQPLITVLQRYKIDIKLFVGGAHLSKKYGQTISEIKKHKIRISGKFSYVSKDDDEKSLSRSLSISNNTLSNFFKKFNFKYVVIFGDRYDLFPILINSVIFKKEILHFGGGETTMGAIDNIIRNIASIASNYHFTCNNEYSKKLFSMGLNKHRIFNVGSLSADAILKIKKSIPKKKYLKEHGLNQSLPLVSLTYHPATSESGESASKKLEKLLKILEKFNLNIIITSPNIEKDSSKILTIVNKYIKRKKNYIFFKSLGFKNYQILLKNSDFIIGNTSSGIMEAPYYKIPSINIGSRQKGRVRHKSVIDCNYNERSIEKSIKKALSKSFKNSISKMKYKFGKGNSAELSARIIKKKILKIN